MSKVFGIANLYRKVTFRAIAQRVGVPVIAVYCVTFFLLTLLVAGSLYLGFTMRSSYEDLYGIPEDYMLPLTTSIFSIVMFLSGAVALLLFILIPRGGSIRAILHYLPVPAHIRILGTSLLFVVLACFLIFSFEVNVFILAWEVTGVKRRVSIVLAMGVLSVFSLVFYFSLLFLSDNLLARHFHVNMRHSYVYATTIASIIILMTTIIPSLLYGQRFIGEQPIGFLYSSFALFILGERSVGVISLILAWCVLGLIITVQALRKSISPVSSMSRVISWFSWKERPSLQGRGILLFLHIVRSPHLFIFTIFAFMLAIGGAGITNSAYVGLKSSFAFLPIGLALWSLYFYGYVEQSSWLKRLYDINVYSQAFLKLLLSFSCVFVLFGLTELSFWLMDIVKSEDVGVIALKAFLVFSYGHLVGMLLPYDSEQPLATIFAEIFVAVSFVVTEYFLSKLAWGSLLEVALSIFFLVLSIFVDGKLAHQDAYLAR